jgi:hypothetical protein
MIAARAPGKTHHLNVFSRARPLAMLLALCGMSPGVLPASPEDTGDAPFVSSAEAVALGARIRQNETGGRAEHLLWWNEGEQFASLGIGHFIWYPEGRPGPFRETFPALVSWLRGQGASLPPWLDREPVPACPWPDRAAFEAARSGDPRFASLRRLLESTVPLQARFLVRRLEAARPRLLEAAPPHRRQELAGRLEALLATPAGRYALVDYVNFKGEGLDRSERYLGEGWGLLQVLLRMDDRLPPVEAFAASAARVLRQRVANAPAARGEARWLPGWLARVGGYPSGP